MVYEWLTRGFFRRLFCRILNGQVGLSDSVPIDDVFSRFGLSVLAGDC